MYSYIHIMSYCSAMVRNNNCKFKAKYKLNNQNEYFCKLHILSYCNIKLNMNYKSIDDIPNLKIIDEISSENIINEVLQNIYKIHNYKLTKIITNNNKKKIEVLVYINNNELEKYNLTIVKTLKLIDEYMNISSSYASILSILKKPICVPIVSYYQDTLFNNLCLVRGWKYHNWYYELNNIHYPLNIDNNKNLIINLIELIKNSQQCRIIHGSIELKNLVQLEEKKLSSVVFKSLKYASFWGGKYENKVDEESLLDNNIKYDYLICSRRINDKKYPCRYDDFESLLYLTLKLLNYEFPWLGLINHNEIVIEKNKFLLYLKDSNNINLSNLIKLILNSDYEDLPNYNKLLEYFSNLF